jgi:cytoskeletal protein RodZ
MPAPHATGGFGSKLREARERRGITLRQIANATKISISALEALERDDISRLPGGIFSRAFVRSYAVEVGLEPEETIQNFVAQFPHDSVTAGHPKSGHIEDREALESERRMASTVLRLVAISVPIVGIVLYFSNAGTRPPEPVQQAATEATSGTSILPPAASAARAEEALPVRVAPSEVAPVVLRPVDTPAAADRLMVGLSATAPCWVSATVDGKQVIRRELKAGEQPVLDVKRDLVLSVGNAGAITVTLNGAPARQLGRPGEVVEAVRINLTNFTDFLAAR